MAKPFCRLPRCQLTGASYSEDLALSTALDSKCDLTSSKVPRSLGLNLYWISLPLRLSDFDFPQRNFLISLNCHQLERLIVSVETATNFEIWSNNALLFSAKEV